ncbi:MAG: hypothetical protein LBV27_04195 [Oscillospiraceae bacterium]|jgi:hypothetical protein|nr:hypothetical protein [Oscillospiraceae bacterium]
MNAQSHMLNEIVKQFVLRNHLSVQVIQQDTRDNDYRLENPETLDGMTLSPSEIYSGKY